MDVEFLDFSLFDGWVSGFFSEGLEEGEIDTVLITNHKVNVLLIRNLLFFLFL